jgi:hypothetical protein
VRAQPHSPRHAAHGPLHTSNCAADQGMIFSGVNVPGQAPIPSVSGLPITAVTP